MWICEECGNQVVMLEELTEDIDKYGKSTETIEKEVTGFYCAKCGKIASTFEKLKEVAEFIED